MNAHTTIEAMPVAHLDKNGLARLVGVPPRAVARWLRGAAPIPHTGVGHDVMFPRDDAIAWMVEHVPLVRPRLAEKGLV